MKNDSTYLVIDIEATCWANDDLDKGEMEMIQIGVVCVDDEGNTISTFDSLIRPARSEVSAYCTDLTGITSEDVTAAADLAYVMERLGEWLRDLPVQPHTWYSWGAWDARQIAKDCERAGIHSPLPADHKNAKKLFQKKQLKGKKQVGLPKALELMGLEFDGTHHSALDDARNVSRLMPYFHTKTAPQKSDAIIDDAWILRFCDAPDDWRDLELLVGMVKEDFKGRFPPDHTFRSSPVQNIDGNMVQTMNTLYQCDGGVRRTTVPSKALDWIMDGYPPEFVITQVVTGRFRLVED